MSHRQRILEGFASRLSWETGEECELLSHRRIPAAIHARTVSVDLAGIKVSFKATDSYGRCTWTFYFDSRGIKRAQNRFDGTDMTAEVIEPSPNLLDVASTMAAEAITAQ